MELTFEEFLAILIAFASTRYIPTIYSIYTGRPKEVLPKIKRRITRLINSNLYLQMYVGRTSSPEEELPRYAGEFDKAVVVYRTTSLRYAHEVEDELIRYYAESILMDILDEGDVGIEKPRDIKEKPPYYVYVVLR